MTAHHIFEHLAVAGISIAIKGDDKLVASPASRLTDELRSMIRANKSELLTLLAKMEDFTERSAIMEIDGGLERPAADIAAHAIVFCRDCVRHIPQPDTVSRSGFSHATPAGCELGLIRPQSRPPIYSFTGWCCHRYTKANGIAAMNALQF